MLANQQRNAAKNAEWYRENWHRVRTQQASYYQAQKRDLQERARSYYRRNRQRVRQVQSAYYKAKKLALESEAVLDQIALNDPSVAQGRQR